MATFSDASCDICSLRHKTSVAVKWCRECDDSLCQECHEHHSLSKSSRHHETILLSDYLKLPPFILGIKYYCDDHNEKNLHYCLNHEKPLCKMCIVTTHKNCKDTSTIDDVIHNAKSSVAMEDLQKNLEDITCQIQLIKEDRETNIRKIDEERSSIQQEIEKIRKQINRHLDRLEREILTELSSTAEKRTKEIADLLKGLKERHRRLNKAQNSIKIIKKYASNFQTSLGTKEMEKMVYEAEQYIQSIVDNKQLNHISLRFSSDSKVAGLISSIEKFGEISVDTSPSEVDMSRHIMICHDMSRHIMTQAQISTPDKDILKSLHLQLNQKIVDQSTIVITGCCFLPNGDIVLVTAFKGLKVYHNAGSFMYEIIMGKHKDAYDVAVADERTVAVTGGRDCHIYIVDIQKRKVTKTVDTKANCSGITYRNGSLIYCLENRGLYMTNLNDSTSKEVYKKEDLSWASYVTIYDDKICFTDCEDNTVTVLNSNFKVVWMFRDTSVLKGPCGITVDDDGVNYVTGCNTHNVVAISPGGKKIKQTLSKENGLNHPVAIHYDARRKHFLVGNHFGQCFLYSVS